MDVTTALYKARIPSRWQQSISEILEDTPPDQRLNEAIRLHNVYKTCWNI